MSLLALHEDAETHFPPWQFVEQHSRPPVHASPSILHVEIPGGRLTPARRGWQVAGVPEHLPEQQSPPAVHEAPSEAHEVALHVLFVSHFPEQQSVGLVQDSPAFLPQNSPVVHTPESQLLEQQSPAELHATPSPPHLHVLVLVSQLPEQQSELAVQPLWFGEMHSPGGFTHT